MGHNQFPWNMSQNCSHAFNTILVLTSFIVLLSTLQIFSNNSSIIQTCTYSDIDTYRHKQKGAQSNLHVQGCLQIPLVKIGRLQKQCTHVIISWALVGLSVKFKKKVISRHLKVSQAVTNKLNHLNSGI